jgi:glycosyltransferase involved in cell wall biosynthesis
VKVLFLVQKTQRVLLSRFYESICRNLGDCDICWLTSDEQSDLKSFFRNIDVGSYDRVILFLRFKREIKQVRFIQTLPGLVILEHDAYQNYINGKYKGRFSRYYKGMPWARVISSGCGVSERLREEGVDAQFVSKGYDKALLKNKHCGRDIELGFIGSTSNSAYSRRRELLEALSEHENLFVTRTNSGEEYCDALNRIKIFVGADVGFGEYMIKNFEAMACGCLLLAWDQGEKENTALGFEDMKNVVLFDDVAGLRKKLALLREKPQLIREIAGAGQELIEQKYSWDSLGEEVAKCVKLPLRRKVVKKYFGIKRYSSPVY